MLAIFKREFKSYFQNVIGWLFVAALLAVYGLYFYVYNLKNGYPYISYNLKGIGFIMMIAVPILTMRSLSDEKKTKTDQLMLTSPVSVGRIVAGKYFAMADRGLKEQFMKMRMEHLTFAEIAPFIHYDKFKSMQVCFCTPYAISILNHLGCKSLFFPPFDFGFSISISSSSME